MENATQTLNVKEMLEKQLQLLSEQSQQGFGSGRDLAEVSRVILDISQFLLQL